MSNITITWKDITALAAFDRKLNALARNFPKVMPRIINQVGDKAKTAVIRSLTTQTGLKRKTIVKAIGSPKRAHAGNMSYTMLTEGGNIRLKYFNPKEYQGGVKAKPWGKATSYAGAFMRGGQWPNRVETAKLNGQVFKRTGRKIDVQKSGVFIPQEMVKGATAQAFNSITTLELPRRIEAAITKLVP